MHKLMGKETNAMFGAQTVKRPANQDMHCFQREYRILKISFLHSALIGLNTILKKNLASKCEPVKQQVNN